MNNTNYDFNFEHQLFIKKGFFDCSSKAYRDRLFDYLSSFYPYLYKYKSGNFYCIIDITFDSKNIIELLNKRSELLKELEIIDELLLKVEKDNVKFR